MPQLKTNFFDLTLSNVPAINNRIDFNDLLGLFRNEEFRKQFDANQRAQNPIRTHYFTWHGRPEVLLSHLLRDALIGLESAVSSAVQIEALALGRWGDDIAKAVENPFTLRGRGTADNVFNKLPAMINASFELKAQDSALWTRVDAFYKKVRNKLLHAYEIAKHDPVPVWKNLELLGEVYIWLNGWHSVERLVSGPIQFGPGARERMMAPPVTPNTRVHQIAPPHELPEDKMGEEVASLHDIELLSITDVTGIYLPSSTMVDISAICDGGRNTKVQMSAGAAMKLLVFLAAAQNKRGWSLPDRL